MSINSMFERSKSDMPIYRRLAAVLVLTAVLLAPLPSMAERDGVTFNFVDVELPVVAKYVSDITGKNFIFDEKLKGKVTIIAPAKLSAGEGFRLFTSVLELKGFTVVPSGVNAYKIIPTSLAKQKGLAVKESGRQLNENYIVRLVRLNHISSSEAVKFLRPVVSRDGLISSFGPGNLLIIIDSGLNIQKILSIIETIDQPTTVEMPEIVFLKHASSEDVARIINEGLKLNVPGAKPRGGAGSGKVVADTRLNAVVIFGSKDTRESLKRLISVLDVPSEEAQGRINVYFLENADAEEMAKVLQGVVKGIEQAKKKAAKAARMPHAAQQEIIITPDKSANALIIMASPSEYRDIASVIERLDRRKNQVYVEALIVEASIDNLFELGAKWRAMATHNGEPIVVGGVGLMDQASLQSVVYGLSGASVGGMGNFIDVPITTIGSDGSVTTSTLTVPGFSALFSLQEFKGAVNVLSAPQILTSDNEEAEIVVGKNVPFITKRESDPNRDASVFTNIERQDVGIKLKITPQIAAGDYVRLSVYQEISAVVQESNADILVTVGPTTTKRSTSTSVVVKDNQTVVIGGLIQEKEEENIVKIPLLGDIPLLGWFFKFRTTNKERTNLLVFITPHIIRDAEDLAALTRRKSTAYARAENIYVPGQLLVRFREGTDMERMEEVLKEVDASIVNYIERLDIYLVRIPADEDVEEAVEDLRDLEEVVYAEPNYQFRIGGREEVAVPDLGPGMTGVAGDEEY